MKERIEYGPKYVLFDQCCLKKCNKSEFCQPDNGFNFSPITIDKEIQDDLNDTEKNYLGNIGVTLLCSLVLSNNFFNCCNLIFGYFMLSFSDA